MSALTDPAPDVLLRVEDLSVDYTRGSQVVRAVETASFSVHRGSRLAIIGESGSGKSTIANALLGLLPENSRIRSGTAHFDELDLLQLSGEREWNRVRGTRIAFIPQDPTIALNPVMRVGAQLAETLIVHAGFDRRTARPRGVELLTSVGIKDADRVYNTFPHQLSGGMRQRVLIAIALAGDPELIIADEPTSGLDVTVQRLVLDLLDELVATRRLSVILITHDLAVARNRADEVLVLDHGTIVEAGRTDSVLATPASEYTRRLIEAAPSLHHARLRPSVEVIERLPPFVETGDDVLLEVSGITKSFVRKGSSRGDSVTFRAVDDVSFTLRRNHSLGLVGESGSGKSTTARIVAGIDRPDAGRLTWDGDDITKRRLGVRRRLYGEIQYVFQNPYSSLSPRFTVEEIISEPLQALRELGKTERQRLVSETLDAVGLPSEFAQRRPAELSGGQRQRVAIARAIALRPRLLVLDEPVSALDVTVQAQVLQLLADLQAEYALSYLFISHDLAVIRLICDEVLVLDQGRLVESNSVTELFVAPEQEYTKSLLAAIP